MNLEVITPPHLSWHVSVSCFFPLVFIIMQTYFFFDAVAITFNTIFDFFCLTLQHNHLSLSLCRPHNQVHGLYNSLARCTIVYLDLAIGHFGHMMLLKME